MTPQQRQACAEEICAKIRNLADKLAASPHAPKPPPGAISKEVAAIIEKHESAATPRISMAEAVRAAVASTAPKLDELTPENIYEKPAPKENNLLASIKSAVKLKPLRVGNAAMDFGVSKDAVIAAVNTPGSGLTVVRPGWIRAV